MQSRDKVVYLASLSLFFSSLELFIPRPLPFFRLGLANIPLLMGLSLPAEPYFLLLLLKAAGGAYISGTIFSVFLLMSLLQTALSGGTMYLLKRIFKENISLYAVSSAGAAISSIAQIAFASLYAGRGALSFLPILLLISLPASIITAYAAARIKVPDRIIIPERCGKRKTSILTIMLFIIPLGAVMMTDGILFSALSCAAAFAMQIISGKKIMLRNHLIMMTFMALSSVLTPEGRVLFSIAGFPVTEDALAAGIARSLRLSAAIALSLAISSYGIFSNGILGDMATLSSSMLRAFRDADGSLVEKAGKALKAEYAFNGPERAFNMPVFILFLFSMAFIIIMIISRLHIFL